MEVPVVINPRFLASSSALLLSMLAIVLLAGCNVDVKKNAQGDEKKVDIETPVGHMQVSKNADVRDTGLPVYPGARPAEKEAQNDDKSANVNISTSWFGLKVVALEYQSDAPSDKLVSFYSNELKKYGPVLRCQTSWKGEHASVDMGDNHDYKDKKDSHELTCDKDHGDTVELKVGTKQNQHLVAIEPQGKGSKFALVYIQVRDKESTI
jgi:uncharacterized protein YfaP (DUF2135 family)